MYEGLFPSPLLSLDQVKFSIFVSHSTAIQFRNSILGFKTSTPNEATLLEALQSFRTQNPAMARAKVLQELKAKNGWVLSEKRLKTCMDTHHLNTEEIESRKMKEAEAKSKIVKDRKSALPKLPQNPLQAQLKYKDESQRYIILYASGEYNYGITPNSDMGIFIGVSEILFFFLITYLVFFSSA
jgi:hypothetical protein